MKKLFIVLLAGLLSTLFAQENVENTDSVGSIDNIDNVKKVETEKNVKHSDTWVKLSGFGYYSFGQIVSGIAGDEWETSTTSILRNTWVNTGLLHLNVESNALSWFTVKLGLESYTTFPLAGANAMDKSSYFRTNKTYLTEAQGIMHWNYENPVCSSLKVNLGMFPYTFNSEVKTLGNYLFRSTIYPLSVQNKIDYPWADILGGACEVGFFDDKFKLGTIIASEISYPPFFDFTPAFTLTVKPSKFVDFGAAFAMYHLIKANSVMPDTLDEKYRGNKGDFRLVLDMKQLFGGMPSFGEEQFKLYGELGIIGKDKLNVDTSDLASQRAGDTTDLKDLTFPEDSPLHRMPLMLGISLPTWKIFDCLSLEFEWFFSPYANDWYGKFDSQKAEARNPTKLAQWDNYINQDNFKWSIYAKKAIGKFEVRGIFGNDHTIYALNNTSSGNFEQTLKRPGDWHWHIQLRYNL
jgi:hypothetical protein